MIFEIEGLLMYKLCGKYQQVYIHYVAKISLKLTQSPLFKQGINSMRLENQKEIILPEEKKIMFKKHHH